MNYEKIYNQIIERSKTRLLTEYKEIHHVIPKCMGGTNDKDNLATLTAREHFICHQLLCEIYPNEHKLKLALNMMCNMRSQNQIRYLPSSRVIAKAKEEGARAISIANTGKKRSDESKARYSLAQMGNKKGVGTVHTKEWKEKMSKARKGIPRPAHVVENLRLLASTRKGKPLSDEVKAKISAKLKGRKFSEEHKAKIVAANTGKTHSEETRKKISNAHKGSKRKKH
jgi:hypothetical protein